MVAIPESLCVLDVDPTRFIQVVSNLLHNAAKFTDPGGFIRVFADVDHEDGVTEPSLTLSVTDSGIGIPADFLPRIFYLFTQVDRESSQPGLGIGLALARRLVEMHGGHIDVRSYGPGRGSEFVIRLPISTQVPASAMPAASAPTALDCRVFVIDDNRDAALATAMLVEQLGGICLTASDGEAALREMPGFRIE